MNFRSKKINNYLRYKERGIMPVRYCHLKEERVRKDEF
jgi:hypothetical protein